MPSPPPNQSEMLVLNYVRAALNSSMSPPVSFHLLSTYGKSMELSPTFTHGTKEKKQCYANSFRMCMDREEYTYCEGYAVPKGLIPLEHAWLVDRDGKVCDPTWDNGTEYYGVKFHRHSMIEIALSTGVFGFLPNLYMLNKSPEDTLRYIQDLIISPS